MCLGALLALCVVACCAYKICGPAEELEWGSQYSVLKKSPRPPPELLRELFLSFVGPARGAHLPRVTAGRGGARRRARTPPLPS
ncbi:hypothetical protein E2C01_076785 [Portunus trituberculatus]|uniref:Secreted protein n=1 Tax=Portunus trituberculatus TaxID=210409 RepID=A0A5B7IJH9_PORTR|nr:hypothetical protein [Portunus trituberculatus]